MILRACRPRRSCCKSRSTRASCRSCVRCVCIVPWKEEEEKKGEEKGEGRGGGEALLFPFRTLSSLFFLYASVWCVGERRQRKAKRGRRRRRRTVEGGRVYFFKMLPRQSPTQGRFCYINCPPKDVFFSLLFATSSLVRDSLSPSPSPQQKKVEINLTFIRTLSHLNAKLKKFGED